MERITKALEIARAARAESLTSPTTPKPVTSNVRMTESGTDEVRVTYCQTRCVAVPRETLRENRVILGEDEGREAAAYRLLRTQVLQRMVLSGFTTLGIVSPRPNEGRSLTAVNLALALAREVRHSVLLVDLDLRNGTLDRLCGVPSDRGLSDYLQSDMPLSELLVSPGIERFVLLPAGRPLTQPSEWLTHPKMARLVTELKNRYATRFVLFDLPAALTRDDVLAFSPSLDALLLVTEEGKTSREDVRRVEELLVSKPWIGSVLNKASNPI